MAPTWSNGKLERDGGKLKAVTMDALSFRQQEQLFHELAQATRSGLSVAQAFELLSRGASAATGARLHALKAHLQGAGSLGGAFRNAGFSEGDAAIIEAGETSGKLDAVFLELSDFYRRLAQARAAIIAKSIYPMLVLHLGVVLLAIPPAILHGGWFTFFAQSLPVLAAFYAALIVAAIFWRTARSLQSRSLAAARALARIPLLGPALRNWTAWKYVSVLSLHIGAGGSMLSAFEAAAAACGDAVFKTATEHAISLVQRGHRLGEAFRDQPRLPELLLRSIEIGEHTGRLEEESARAAEFFKDKTLQALDAFAQWAPRLLYILIVFFIGWRILAMAFDISSQISSALNIET